MRANAVVGSGTCGSRASDLSAFDAAQAAAHDGAEGGPGKAADLPDGSLIDVGVVRVLVRAVRGSAGKSDAGGRVVEHPAGAGAAKLLS